MAPEDVIYQRLRSLHANNLEVVPQIGRNKTPFPMRDPCERCPGWRDSGNWDKVKKRWRRIPPQRAHAQDEAAKVKTTALEGGANASEARKAHAETEERVLHAHDVPDRPELWAWHVRGEDDEGNWYHRGAYSHRDKGQGLDVIWDLDKGQHPFAKARLILGKLRELGLGEAAYANTSFSGNGVHVRLCHALAPSWVRYAFGRKLLESVGLTPGNDPGKGQTESFPKQEEHSYVGNMVGLPCSIPRMKEGATCLLDEEFEPVQDLAWTAQRLAGVVPAPLEALNAAARELGFDPVNRPVPEVQVPLRAPGAPVTLQIPSGRQITYTKDRLVAVIREQLPMETYLHQIGAEDKGGGKYCCPVHREPPDGNPSFHVFTATRLGGVHERYQCFGDCAGSPYDGGDVIDLVAVIRGTNRRTAKTQLATELNLDPASYKDTVRGEAKALQGRPCDSLSVWVAHAFDIAQKPLYAAKAILRVIFESGISYERGTATVWKAMQQRGLWTKGQCYANAAEVVEGIQAKRQRAGSSWLIRTLGLIEIRRFARLLARAADKRIAFIYKKVLGFRKFYTGTQQRKFLRSAYAKIPEAKKKERWQTEEPHEFEHVRNMMRRPCVCRHFQNVARVAGEKIGSLPLPCNVDLVCPMCAMVRYQASYGLVSGQIDSAYSWEGLGPYWAVWIDLPPDCYEHIPKMKRRIGREGDQRLTTVTCDPVTGAPGLFYLTTDKTAANSIRSAAKCYALVAGIETKISAAKKTHCHDRAATWLLDAQLEGVLHTSELIRLEDEEGLLKWLSWWKGKHKVRRSKGGLPWPSREAIRAATQTESNDLADYPDEYITWDAVHVATGYVILKGLDHPASIDEVASAAGKNEDFADAAAAKQAEIERRLKIA